MLAAKQHVPMAMPTKITFSVSLTVISWGGRGSASAVALTSDVVSAAGLTTAAGGTAEGNATEDGLLLCLLEESGVAVDASASTVALGVLGGRGGVAA